MLCGIFIFCFIFITIIIISFYFYNNNVIFIFFFNQKEKIGVEFMLKGVRIIGFLSIGQFKIFQTSSGSINCSRFVSKSVIFFYKINNFLLFPQLLRLNPLCVPFKRSTHPFLSRFSWRSAAEKTVFRCHYQVNLANSLLINSDPLSQRI